MATLYRAVAVACLLASLEGAAQRGNAARTIVLPNPQLIHCHSAECSQLWKQNFVSGRAAVYPAQVLTDLVNGEVVGLTAVYDKSVSTAELRATINRFYEKWFLLHSDSISVWRIESEQFAISIADGADGAKEVIYLKFGAYESHGPSAHLACQK